ncbi:MAG: glycosyltransferase family 39 protein [Chloroflexota bacterium]
MKRWQSILLVTAILLLAAALRISGAGSIPVWTDEGWSAWATRDPAQVIGMVAADRHPPLYFAVLSVWRQAAGDSHLALRFLSIAAGVLTVAAVYRIGADWFGRRAGVLAAVLFAALPAAVYYGQEVRHYSALTLLTALSWLVLLRFLRRPSKALWVAYVISVAAMLYTLYFGAFTVAAQGVAGLIVVTVGIYKNRRAGDLNETKFRGRPYEHPVKLAGALVGAWVAAGVLYLPWIYVILTQQAGILKGGISGAPGTLAPGDLLAVLQTVFSTQVVIPLAAFALGAWAMRPWRSRRRSVEQVAVLMGGGALLLALWLLSVPFDLLSARTLVFVTPLLMVVCGYGLSRIHREHAAGLIGVWLVATLALPQVIQPRLDSGAAARALAAAYQAGDAVILETGWDDNAFAYEIAQLLPSGAEITRTQPWTNERTGGGAVVPEIEPVLQAHNRVWVVQWLQAPQVLPFLEGGGDGYRLEQTLDVSAGAYGERFGAPTMVVRLYVRPDGADLSTRLVSSG